MITGASDNNVMIWTSPFDGYQGEVIEGVDMNLPKAKESKRNSELFIKQNSVVASDYEAGNVYTGGNEGDFY